MIAGKRFSQRTVPLAVLGLAVVAAFLPMFRWMGERFAEPNSYYSHGYLIPLVVAALIWRQRDALKAVPLSSSPAGLPVLLAGLGMYLLGGIVLKIGFIAGVAFLIVLFGLVLYVFGAAVTRTVAFPLLFTGCMVPVPKVLLLSATFKLKLMAAALAEQVVTGMHIPLARAGSILYLPGGTLIVEEECSGISSLISLVTLSLLFAYVAQLPVYKRGILVLSALPVALAANVVRIIFLVLAAYVYGVDAVHGGILHTAAGCALWGVAVALFMGVWRVLAWKPAA
jgi:exosortase